MPDDTMFSCFAATGSANFKSEHDAIIPVVEHSIAHQYDGQRKDRLATQDTLTSCSIGNLKHEFITTNTIHLIASVHCSQLHIAFLAVMRMQQLYNFSFSGFSEIFIKYFVICILKKRSMVHNMT